MRFVPLLAALSLVGMMGSPTGAAGGYDWATWGFDIARSGYNPLETTLSASNVGTLVQKWTPFPLNGTALAQAIYASGVTVGSVARNVVYVGSNSGNFYAVDADTGQQIWSRSFGVLVTSCGDTAQGRFGIMSTAAFDRPTNRVYVATREGKLYALDMSTGSTVSGWPVTVSKNPTHEFPWSAISLKAANQNGTPNGVVYVPIGSHCDDTPFHGQVVRVSIPNHSVMNTWCSNGCQGPYGGAIWAYGGVSIDGSGRVFAVPDEAHPDPANQVNSEHVVRLSASLSVQATHYWNPPGTNRDEGYGTTPMAYSTSCGNRFAILNKSGYLAVFSTEFTNSSSPLQVIKLADSSKNYRFRLIGETTMDPTTKTIFVANTNTGAGKVKGLIAFRPNQSKSGCPLEMAWQQADPSGQTAGAEGMPMVANGVVYYSSGNGQQVLAYPESGGSALWASPTLNGDVYSAPTIANGMVFVSTYSWSNPSASLLYAFGLP